jgi:hypothetical protein
MRRKRSLPWSGWAEGKTARTAHCRPSALDQMPQRSPSKLPFAELANPNGVVRSAERTKRPYARAAIANAAFPRSCSRFHAAMQPKSRKQPFIDADVSGFQTDPSPHLARIDRGRTNGDFAADAPTSGSADRSTNGGCPPILRPPGCMT